MSTAAADAKLRDAAAAVLAQNERGGYTVPTAGLYPMQFNWDSAFAALGFAALPDSAVAADFPAERGWRELENIAAAQKADGMLPHIIFRGDYGGYFPGPDIWQAGGAPPTSGISNPPVAALAAATLRRKKPLADKGRYRRLLRALAKWHKWLADCLHPLHNFFVAAHPWETGRDNLCDWDAAMRRIRPRDHGDYTRSDTRFVDAAQRPSRAEYDGFLEIIAVGRDTAWQQKTFRQQTPFKMGDPGITAILAAAADALDEMLGEENMAEELEWTRGIGARAREGLAFLWNEAAGGYVAYDVEAGEHLDGISSAAFLAPLAGIFEGEKHKKLMAEFDRIAAAAKYTMPSYDPAAAGFEAKRYWRGPVWLPFNLLIALGFARAGETARAGQIAEASLRLARDAGFYEYFCPHSGAGLGGAPFTWTAAAALVFLQWESWEK